MSVFVKCEYEEIRCKYCDNEGELCIAIIAHNQHKYWFKTDWCEDYEHGGMGRDCLLSDACASSYKKQKVIAKFTEKFDYTENGYTIIGNTRIPNALIGYLSVDFGDHTEVYINNKVRENSKEEKTT